MLPEFIITELRIPQDASKPLTLIVTESLPRDGPIVLKWQEPGRGVSNIPHPLFMGHEQPLVVVGNHARDFTHVRRFKGWKPKRVDGELRLTPYDKR